MFRKTHTPTFRFERLEPRLLLSADPIVSGLALLAPDPSDGENQLSLTVPYKEPTNPLPNNDNALDLADVATLFANAEEHAKEVLFLNGDVEDHLILTQQLSDDVDVVILDSTRDGIEQISNYLATTDTLSAIHIASHGNADGFWLGNTFLDGSTLHQEKSRITAWSSHLSEDADLLIYGCDLASSDTGKSLLLDLATFTESDVAASDDLTGATNFGGDWSLEFNIGEVESNVVFGAAAQAAWSGTLGSITVTTDNDQLDGDADTSSLAALALNPGADGFVSLREAIQAANATSDEDIIFLGSGDYQVTRSGVGDDFGDYDIRFSVSFVGISPNDTTIRGDGLSRVFEVHDDVDVTVTFSDLKIEDGRTNIVGGRDGAGIFVHSSTNTATIDINNVWFVDNKTDLSGGNGSGGAIYNEGILTISNSLFEDSAARFEGGAIYNASGATLTLNSVTISGSQSTNADGGGIYNAGTATIINATVTQNAANGDGGGISNFGTLSLGNSIVADNTSGGDGPDIDNAFTSLGYNIFGDDSNASGFVGSDQRNIDPLLGLLIDNGGELKTHALGAASTAINNADATLSSNIDQTGRLRDSTPDIGAYEVGATATPATATLRFSTDKAVSSGGQDGLDSWDEADVMSFDSPLLNLGVGTTSGTVSNVINFGAATPGLEGLHFVSTSVDIAGGAFTLNPGDVLFNSSSNSAIFASNNVVPLEPGFSANVNADRGDIVVFRPDTLGDYSAGQFAFLLDDIDGGNLHAFTLVESDITVGGSSLSAGDFLHVRSGGSDDNDIAWFSPTAIGDGTTTGALNLLLDGDDTNVGIAEQIHGLELIENTVTVGNVTLQSGQLLVSVNGADSVGANNLSVAANDIFVLDVTQSTESAGAGNGQATTTKFFTGSHAGFDTNDERFNSLALEASLSAPTADESAGAPHTIAAGGTLALDGSNSIDTDGTIASYEWDINNDGSFEKSGITTSFNWAELNSAGVTTDGTYDVALRVTDNDGLSHSTVFTLTVNNANPTFTNFAAPIDTVNEDVEVEITFAELAAQGDEADIGGAVNSFVVQAVSTGNLKIGASAGAATAFSVGVNDVIGTGLNAYWTPANNQNGTLDAFTVEARDDDGALSGTPVTAQVNVTSVNDAPTISGGPVTIGTIDEDTASNGVTVGSIVAGFTGSDNDGDSLGIAVTNIVGRKDWQFSLDSTDGLDGTWTDFPSVNPNSALLLSATTWVRYDPDKIGPETASLEFAAWDGTSGSASTAGSASHADTTPGGGDTAFSTNTVTASYTVTDVNDDPTFTSFTAPIDTTNEDIEVEITFAELAAQGNEADVDGTVDSFVVQAVSSGTLRIGANAGTATAFAVGVNDVIGTGLNAYWTPANNQNGTLNAFTVEAQDDDGALSGTPVIAQVNVNDVNDDPTFTSLTNVIAGANESVEELISFSDIHLVSDAVDPDGSISGYVVKNVLTGSLRIGSSVATATAWSAGVNDMIDSTNLAFWTSAPGASGATNAFSIVAVDDDGAESPALVTAQLNVFATNQAPTLNQNTITIAEGESKTITTGDLSATDVDDPAATIQFSIGSVTNGQFERLSAPGAPINSFTQADILSGDVRFVHDGGENAPSYNVTVTDGSLSTAVSPVTVMFTPVNDAPSITLNKLSIEQDGSVTLSVGENLAAADPDHPTATLTYSVASISGGRFELLGAPGIAVTNFTGAELLSGNVKFVHDGSTTIPSYVLSVSDGSATSAPSSVNVNFIPTDDDDFFDDEAIAAENYASEITYARASVSADESRDNTESSTDNDVDEASFDLLLSEKALALANAGSNEEEQQGSAGPLFTIKDVEESSDKNQARGSASEQIRKLISEKLVLASEVTEPLLGNIDASLELMTSVVQSSNFKNSLDVLRDDVANDFHLQQAKIGSSIAVSTGLSIGYVVWLIRGGVLVSSMLSALPAWRFIDPLPILAFGGTDDDEDQESLESLVKSSPKPTPEQNDKHSGAEQ